MSKAPEVTVVIPAYNAERHLGETLDSVLAQTFADFEVVVVDDASSDRTGEIVRSYCERDPRVRAERTAANSGGPAGPRNLGVRLARGEWIAFCDADDLWMPHKLERQMPVARSSDCALVSTALADFRDGERLPAQEKAETTEKADGEPVTREIGIGAMFVKNWIALASVVVRRERIVEAGFFDEGAAFVAVEDYDLWTRIMDSTGKPALRIDEKLLLYRRVAGSLSERKWTMVRKSLRVQRRLWERRGLAWIMPVLAPFHVAAYVAASLWVRKILKTL